jgi:hypothetical protein
MKWYGWAGILLLLVAEFALSRKVEPFYSWFYCFAWWSYIVIADSVLARVAGRSLLTSRRRELPRMMALSVFVWLIFEAYNISIRNWAYTGVPALTSIRWAGYSVAFATVLPGIFITADLMQAIWGRRAAPAPSESIPVPPRRPASSPSRVFLVIGIALTIGPVFWPRFFFPAVWIGPIFLLDPALERMGVESLSMAVASGNRSRHWSLLAGGFVCGGLWEFWNFWAASKWVYTVPYFGAWKIFEMPLLGFLGFPPFALECWILYHLFTALIHRIDSTAGRAALWCGIAIFCIMMFRAIDKHTVMRFSETAFPDVSAWLTGSF